MLVMVIVMVMMFMVVVMAMVMLVLVFFFQVMQRFFNGIPLFHRRQNLRSRKCIPIRGDNRGICIMLPQDFNDFFEFFLVHALGVAQDDRTCMFNLVIIKFAEVFHINLDFFRVHDGGKSVKFHLIKFQILYRLYNVAEFANPRRLNQNSVRMKLCNHLFQRLAEISHQAATNAARVHFVDLNSRVFEEPAVDTDFSKLVLYQYHLFALVGFFDELLNQSGLAGSQKA